MKTFQAIVIGSGQAGNPLAHRLADTGWTVALIEREHLGGSCINYGCTPTKTMIASSQVAHYARRATEFGVSVGPVAVDLSKVVARKNEIVRSWREGHERQVARRPTITLYRGVARFTGPHTLTVNGEELNGEHIFINTGTSPRVPPIEGLRDVPYLTNKTIMDLTQIPEHLIVLGGSYVGLEFGQMFRRFGSQVTVIEYGDQIVPREDEDVARAIQEALAAEGITFLVGAEARAVASTGGEIRVTAQSRRTGTEQTVQGSHLLVAVGRQPNTDDLGLEAAGIAHRRGWVTVNEYLETNVPGVYTLGDVNGGPAFTHISYNDFQIAFHRSEEHTSEL